VSVFQEGPGVWESVCLGRKESVPIGSGTCEVPRRRLTGLGPLDWSISRFPPIERGLLGVRESVSQEMFPKGKQVRKVSTEQRSWVGSVTHYALLSSVACRANAGVSVVRPQC